jgi:hypothetical protein
MGTAARAHGHFMKIHAKRDPAARAEADGTRDKGGTQERATPRKRSKNQGDAPHDASHDVVARGTALRLAAQWLGVSADVVIDGSERAGEVGSPGQGVPLGISGERAYAGLGLGFGKKAGYVSKSARNSAWNRKVDERLMDAQGRKRKGAQHKPDEGERVGEGGEDGEEYDEEGESQVVLRGTREKALVLTKDALLRRAPKKKKRKK